MGRFTSVDPAAASARAATPQSWNRYSYALNNPLFYVDPTGEDWAGKKKDKNGDTQPEFFDNKIKDKDGKTAYDRALANGYTALTPNRDNGDFVYVAFGRGDSGHAYALHADGSSGWVNPNEPAVVDMMPGQAIDVAVSVTGGRAIGDVFGWLGGTLLGRAAADVAEGVTNPIPGTLARAIPGEGPFPTLGRAGAQDVFVTAADDIAGMNAGQIGPRLGIGNSDVFTVIEFPTPRVGLASPVNRTDLGFLGFGRTTGGAREFVLPNGPIPANATTRIVR